MTAKNFAHSLVVLVVEDEPLVRGNVVECLQNAGYVVVETESGEEAIAFGKSDMSIDIVFTDINLAGAANGWDVAEAFRVERPKVPVLYTSGKPVNPFRRIPGSVFVAKPYQVDEIVHVAGSCVATPVERFAAEFAACWSAVGARDT
jgi:CheY-like chemotaxis protein